MGQIISSISGDIDKVVESIGKVVSDVTVATKQLTDITSSFANNPKLEGLDSFKVTQSDPSDIKTAIKTAMTAAQQKAHSFFTQRWSSIAPAGVDSGVVQDYVQGGNVQCVIDQMKIDFQDWEIDADSKARKIMARTIAEEIKAKMGVPGASHGIHSINMNQQINWTVTYGIFALGDDKQGLVYGFAAALDSDFSFKQEMTHGLQLTREHLKEIKTSVEKSLNQQPISLKIQLGEKQDEPKTQITIGHITTPNPTLWWDTSFPYGPDLYVYEISTSQPSGEFWEPVNQFCSILSVEWLKARAFGENPDEYKLQQFSDDRKTSMARDLINFNGTGDGMKAQEHYAESALGGESASQKNVFEGMNPNSKDPYPQGTQIWAGSSGHVVAYYITSNEEYEYYDPNTGKSQTRKRSDFQNEYNANVFVVAKKK